MFTITNIDDNPMKIAAISGEAYPNIANGMLIILYINEIAMFCLQTLVDFFAIFIAFVISNKFL